MGWEYSLSELAGVLGAAAPEQPGCFTSVSTDTRTLKVGAAFFALSGAHHDGNSFVEQAFDKGASVAIVSRAMSTQRPTVLVENPLRALQDFAAYHRMRFRLPVLAITGSCGKTTAKDLTAGVLATRYRVTKTLGNLNNEIGCPLSLFGIDAESGFAVIEMGANHAGEIAGLCSIARPTESAVTLVAPGHLEGFGSIERVASAKEEIVRALPPEGVFYVNMDNVWCRAMADRFAGRKIRFGRGGEDVKLLRMQLEPDGETELEIDPIGRIRLPLPVPAHVTNVLLAVAVGLVHGVRDFEHPLRQARAGASRFKILKLGPLEVLDDTYNANPASMAAALEALAVRPTSGKRMAALGEMLELGSDAERLHRELGAAAAHAGVSCLFARGPHAHAMIAAARAAGVPHAEALDSHDDIARAIHSSATRGDVLLLKGSRGMAMERVIPQLAALLGVSGPETASGH